MLEEEDIQRRLFEVLQLQQDAKYSRVSKQIETIQKELSELSWLEIKQKEMRQDNIIVRNLYSRAINYIKSEEISSFFLFCNIQYILHNIYSIYRISYYFV